MFKKICNQCNEAKEINEFPKCTKEKDGYSYTCKTCTNTAKQQRRKLDPDRFKEYNQKWEETHKEQIRETKKKWWQRNPKKASEYHNRMKSKYPEKFEARQAVAHAVQSRKLPPAKVFNCVYCMDNKASEYHHYNGYEKKNWLDVKPVCRSCHEVLDKS